MTVQPKAQPVPQHFIYEMDEGKPVYYKGYRDVLIGRKNLEEIMGDSSLQAWLKGKLFLFLSLELDNTFDLTVGEHGLYFGKHSWRAADIAIFRKEKLTLDKHYSKIPPEVVIEIDTKAELESLGEALDYYEKKTAQLLDFGVQKVLWIFTDSKQIKVISANQTPQTFGWNEEVPVIGGVHFNISEIFRKFGRSGQFD